MGLGGLITGAIAGGAQAVNQLASGDIEDQRKIDVANQMAQIEQQKDQAAANYRYQLQNQMRQDTADRVKAAQQDLANQQLDQKYSSAKDAWDSMTPEQQQVVQQSRDADLAKLMQDPDLRAQAAIQTGDINPEQAATLNSKQEIAQLRAQGFADKLATMSSIADMKNQTAMWIASLKAQNGRGSGGGSGDSELHKDLRAGFAGIGHQLVSVSQELKSTTNMLLNVPKSERPKYEAQVAQLKQRQAGLVNAQLMIGRKMGMDDDTIKAVSMTYEPLDADTPPAPTPGKGAAQPAPAAAPAPAAGPWTKF